VLCFCCCLYLFVHSGVQHILCCVFVVVCIFLYIVGFNTYCVVCVEPHYVQTNTNNNKNTTQYVLNPTMYKKIQTTTKTQHSMCWIPLCTNKYKQQQKHNTVCVEPHYVQTNTNNNKNTTQYVLNPTMYKQIQTTTKIQHSMCWTPLCTNKYKQQQKHNTVCVEHHYVQTNTCSNQNPRCDIARLHAISYLYHVFPN
jgi:hypothetical protein